ncbi:MAG TPA: hypothetical protein ENN64_00250 [bacterium]|nr:hypothetical protein [bacterium]
MFAEKSRFRSDSAKRAKMFLLSFIIAVAIFVHKLLQRSDSTILYLYGIAFGGAIISYFGLLWVSNFIVNKKVLLFIIPQASFLIFSQILFMELFFFAKFVRIYEALLFFLLLLIIGFAANVTFLMANIFIVSSVRPIPLEQVAKTTSYILTVLSAYFITFSILSTALSFPLTLLILLILYIMIVAMHLLHIKLSIQEFWSGVLITSFNMFQVFIAFSQIGRRYEIIALGPVIAMLTSIGVIVGFSQKNLTKFQLFLYILSVLLVVFLNIYFA